MTKRFDMRKLSMMMALAIVVAAVALPLCQMAACGMVSGSMSIPQHSGTAIQALCEAAGMTSTSPLGIMPATLESLLLALAVVLAVAMAMLVSTPRVMRVRFAEADEPPRPLEDPRGVRLII